MPTRWHTLRPINEDQPSWLEHRHLARLRASCARIVSRVHGLSAYIDTFRRAVCFGYHNGGNVNLLDIICPLYRGPITEAGFDPILDRHSEDEVVRMACLARVGARFKERWRQAKETTRANDAKEAAGRLAQDKAPQVEEFLRRRRERRGMGRHFKRSQIVNGTKG